MELLYKLGKYFTEKETLTMKRLVNRTEIFSARGDIIRNRVDRSNQQIVNSITDFIGCPDDCTILTISNPSNTGGKYRVELFSQGSHDTFTCYVTPDDDIIYNGRSFHCDGLFDLIARSNSEFAKLERIKRSNRY
jgi:hypothetical protein